MAELFGDLYTADIAAGTSKMRVAHAGGRMRVMRQVITLAAQAIGDTIRLGRLPKGAVVSRVTLNASATLGATATIAIGIAGAAAKYKTAAVFTTANAPVNFGVNAGVGVVLTAIEEPILTVAAAALPASGRLVVEFYYTVD